MRIVSVEPFVLQFSPTPTAADLGSAAGGPCYLLGLQTDEGQRSLGEAYLPSERHLADAVELFAPVLAGADPRDRGVLWERLVAVLSETKVPLDEYMGALSAADLALWDLAGQACGLPVFRLLGGAQFSPLDTYLLPPENLATPADLLQWATELPAQSAGGIGIEVSSAASENLDLVRKIRQQIGSQRRLIVRFTEGCPDMDSARRAAETLAKAEVFWAENLLPSGRWAEYAQLRQTLDLPLAAGADLWGIKQFHELTQSEAVDIVVVDLRICGGITAAVKIADLARLGGMRVVFQGGRCPLTILAAAHLSAAVAISLPVALPVSFTTAPSDFFAFAGQLENGFLRLPDQPGFGGQLGRRYLYAPD